MNKKTIVLVGGCFDILHPGHVIFLQKAKKLADKLVILLESDKKIKKIKGTSRPIHSQKQRAYVLKSLKFVDEVISLPFIEKEEQYGKYIKKIKPDFIATTAGDPQINYKKAAAKLVGASLKVVTKRVGNYSTSLLIDY
jgi:FAD synthetase